jgi:hypothetical protein
LKNEENDEDYEDEEEGGLSLQTTNSRYGDLGDLENLGTKPSSTRAKNGEEKRRDEEEGRDPIGSGGEKGPQRRKRSGSVATGRSLQLSQTATRRAENVLSRVRSRPPIGNFSHPLEHVKTTVDDLVDFDGPDDPYRPVNWTMRKKVMTTALYGYTTMSATWASSAFSPGTDQVAAQFHVGTQVATLGTTLFLFGFGVSLPAPGDGFFQQKLTLLQIGPLLWAPLSEVYGRKNAVLPPMFVAACFSFATGAAKDIQTIMITRFFAG